jgi:hypothetical protein
MAFYYCDVGDNEEPYEPMHVESGSNESMHLYDNVITLDSSDDE